MHSAYESLEKRAELVRAAMGLLHEQGYQRTAFAKVATPADVPLGNVYYYFKTKWAFSTWEEGAESDVRPSARSGLGRRGE
jgi:AcrR family transcriptional regulator